jgi:hypothetical protein
VTSATKVGLMKVLSIKVNSKILVLKKTEEGMTIGEPKDFDFSNFEAIENLQTNAQNIKCLWKKYSQT